jgi:O-antigen/teichoic acid export membrane protein
MLVEGGLGSALVQKQSTSANDETSVFLVNLGMGCLLAALLWVAAPAIAGFYAQPVLVPLLQLLVWMLPLGALAAVPNALLSKRLDFRKRAAAELVASSGWLAWRGHGVWSLAWQAVAGAALRAVMLWLLSGWRPRGRFDPEAFSRLLRFGGYLLLANALNLVSMRLQSLLIGRLFDARALGFYVMAQDTQQAPAQFISSLLNRVGLPMFSAVAEQPEKLAGSLRLSLRLSMFVFVPAMIGIAVVAKPLILVLYGPAWAPSAPLVAVLALAAGIWPLHVLNLAALGARGRPDLVFKLEIAKALTSIPLILAASTLGVMAIAWAVLVSGLVSVGINTWYSTALLGYGLRAQLRDLLPIFLLAFFSAGCAWLASGFLTSPESKLVLAVATAAATYVACAALFRLQAWRDLLDFAQALRDQPSVPRQGEQ